MIIIKVKRLGKSLDYKTSVRYVKTNAEQGQDV